MELKDGKIVVSEEEKKILGSNEGKNWLKENKFVAEVEKKVEIEKPLTDEVVKDYIGKNQSLADKIYNENATKFLKAKLGKDVTIDDLGKDILLKDEFTNFKSQAIKTAVSVALDGIAPKHSKLLINAVDYSKLDLKDNQLIGFDTELNNLKITYPDLFTVKGVQTPPALIPNGQNKKITYEDFEKMTPEERQKVPTEQLNEFLK